VKQIDKDKIVNYFVEHFISITRYLTITLGTGLTWLFGGWTSSIQILIFLMIFDYITGLIKSYLNKTISSDIGFKGILKKATIFIVIIVAVMLDKLLNTGSWVFRTLVCYFYIANEGISLLENLSEIGLPIPAQLKDALEQLEKKNDGSDNQDSVSRETQK
jgi:toxin secretion/phage lysis holin